ncbi:MAG: radical SAM protein [Methanomicrobiales archaeon]|nr:radical SAM protein [Methanomicrobiales archaeon]
MPHVHITRRSGIPLIGCLYFGVIDRGTSLLQVRPSCRCNLSCPFCSVDAGPDSRTRVTSYEVEREYLVETVRSIAQFKVAGVEAHIDSPGEPMLYPDIVALVRDLRKIPEISVISMQSNGTLLREGVIADLASAGLDRINLSMHALDPDLARCLAGVSWYDVTAVAEAARAIAQSSIDLLISPVHLPGLNDEEIPRLIRFARTTGAGKRWPPLGIQKFEEYRWGRTPPNVHPQSWGRFFSKTLPAWEEESGMRLRLTPADFAIEKRPMIPRVFRKGERAEVEIVGPGWIQGEVLGAGRGRVVSVMGSRKRSGTTRVRFVSAKHNIYVAVPA